MIESQLTVFLVDDDPGVLKALAVLLTESGFDVRAFSTPHEFLSQHDPSVPGCAVLDVAMPGLDGLELQASLATGKLDRPVIFITGVGDVPTSVRAMKAGAIDFLTKPVSDDELLAAIARATEKDAESRTRHKELQSINERLAKLTPREREVLTHVIAGRLNKQIAHDLGLVLNTVKIHRGRVMEKMGVKSVAELVRHAELAGVRAAKCPSGP
ncbi:response regulator [Bradyrhizobium sp. SRL28]|uniref:response regulator transcription factor n=1 Tax=Bradyrhizobium sp. SRL28 TaxID=2836178 RepID=UPI001BDE3D90|nr:response regulator [Bradyrhizobium sp. SRL28]MBT1514452.1 response regulator [Bradyrhizobium sp. SRL28]